MVVLQNQLPIPVSCVVSAMFGDPYDTGADDPLYEEDLIDVRLVPGAAQIANLPLGQWPVQLRSDALGIPYSASSKFIALDLKCRIGPRGVGGHDHLATFVNADYWDGEHPVGVAPRRPGELAGASVGRASTLRIDPQLHPGSHALKSYTPTDYTAFVVALRAAGDAVSATQLLAGAAPFIVLSAIPLQADGTPLRAALLPLGHFRMEPPPVDDGAGPPSAPALSETLSEVYDDDAAS